MTVWPIFRLFQQRLSSRHSSDRDARSADSHWAAPLLKLGLTPEELNAVLHTGALEPHFTYTRYRRPKRSGGWREIAEPDTRLKRIQRSVVRQYLGAEPVHPSAVAYQPGKCTRDHVRPHLGAEVIVTADVRDFFPSTRTERVRLWWTERIDREAADVLAILTTDRGGLPQGAPTSPALSNLINFELDQRIAARAAVAGATYTRYCDDLAFSWPHGGPPADFERAVRGALHEFGYALHPEKGWCVHERSDEPEITGLVVTRAGRLRLPDRVREVMRALARSDDSHNAERLAGYLGYKKMVTGRHSNQQ